MCYLVRVYVCSLRYPAYIAHAPCCLVDCAAVQYFSVLSNKRHDLKQIFNVNCVF